MSWIKTVLIAGCVLTLAACSKNKNKTGGPDGGAAPRGQIYYDYAGTASVIDLSTNQRRDYFNINSYSFNNWDLSLDKKIRLQSERRAGDYTQTRFIVLNADDNTTIREFDYAPQKGTAQNYAGLLSHDNSMILIRPDDYNGLVILDQQGNVKYRLDGVNNTRLERGDEAHWLPGNSLLITMAKKYLFKCDPPYTNLTLIKEITNGSWGNINPSRDGKRVSFYLDNHIHVMNMDGTGMTQVTESSSQENAAIFSPDGSWLLVGANYTHAPISGRSNWKIKIIPADGSKYNLDDGPGVIRLEPVNDNLSATSSGKMMWR